MDRFSQVMRSWDVSALLERARESSASQVQNALSAPSVDSLETFATLLSPQAAPHLETLARRAQKTTRANFGKTVRMFVPLYVTNACINNCKYCGFGRRNQFPRKTISADEIQRQTEILAAHGFRSLLLVAGEHPVHASAAFMEECIRRGLKYMPSVGLEIAPADVDTYRGFVEAGSDSLTAFQETYHEPTYLDMHPSGPKRDYAWRVDTQQRAAQGGFRRVGLGALFGLYDWRYETICLAAHARWLLKHCWRSAVSISFPRMRPALGGFAPKPENVPTDRQFTQLMCALRLLLPTVGFVLSTLETPKLRDHLAQLAVTQMSAGASTEPGGYSDCRKDSWRHIDQEDGEQFHVADERTPEDVARSLKSAGLEPVWKDFDTAFLK